MNRSKKLTGIIATLIGMLKSYKVEKEESLNVWLEMLSDEQMMKVEQKESVQLFLNNLSSICNEVMKAKLVDILLEKFKDSKMGQQMVDNI